MTGIDKRILSRIEVGANTTMYVEQAIRIARALGVTVEDLMEGWEPRGSEPGTGADPP
jgi:hypothetical protein